MKEIIYRAKILHQFSEKKNKNIMEFLRIKICFCHESMPLNYNAMSLII